MSIVRGVDVEGRRYFRAIGESGPAAKKFPRKRLPVKSRVSKVKRQTWSTITGRGATPPVIPAGPETVTSA